ncbi:MAG: hypothetical protein U9O89_06625 [Thermoproteota archaeon]|nr:hypothetical protein [Thermoproteota archaeon]
MSVRILSTKTLSDGTVIFTTRGRRAKTILPFMQGFRLERLSFQNTLILPKICIENFVTSQNWQK